ncbi:MAG: glycosyltransferase family 4 protein [Gemmatimonadales bacterium]|nr:glycosyltransferase family 4 protein [Gemmatimonadales bacterium]
MATHLLLTYDFPPMGGGIARWMGELAQQYPAGSLVVSTGHQYDSEDVDRSYANRIDRVSVPARRLRTVQGLVRWTRRARSVCRSEGVEFVWCGQLRPAAYPARWLFARTRMPYGVLVYGGDLLTLRRRIRSARKRPIIRSLLGNAGAIVAISRWTADLCGQVFDDLRLPLPDARLHVVPLGTDPDRFRPGLDPSAARMAFDLPEGRWLVTVARLLPHKGIDTGIRCLAALGRDVPELRYAVAGTGPDLERLAALARDLAVRDRVHFLGHVPDAHLPALYNMAEVYLAPSRLQEDDVEGFGIAISEASASGLPVVAGRSGGTADAVRDGETGLLVDPEDPDAFIEAARLLLSDRALAGAMGRAGRRAVETFFNWDRVARAMRDIGCRAAVERRTG